MPIPQTTDWEQIAGAAAGDEKLRESFADRYEGLIRRRLLRGWKERAQRAWIDDAVQEVFVECFKAGGVLASADPAKLGGFRRFLLGVVDNVARRFEERARKERARAEGAPFEPDATPHLEPTPSRQFDRAWVLALLEAAARAMSARAERLGGGALRRVELLNLRLVDEKPIREIAALWDEDPDVLHHQYGKAREEFRSCLLEVLGRGRACTKEELQAECDRLLRLLRS